MVMVKRKILFKYDECSDGRHEIESMWADPQSNGYKIDNIPFHAKEVACGDVVSATTGPNGELCYNELVSPSGHSTVRLWFAHERDIPRVRNELRELGCDSEQSELARLIAVDVPPDVPYSAIKSWLDAEERAGVFEYEEGCLGQSE